MDKIYFTDTQIVSLSTEIVAEEMPAITSDGSSVSVFGDLTVIASPFDRKLIAISSKGVKTVVDYANHSYRTMPFAITHDNDGKLYMLRDNYNFGWDAGTVARFASPSGEEETLEAEVRFEQAGPLSSIVVNGDFVYFTSTEWNRNWDKPTGTSVWRLPLDFTNRSAPEEVFNIEKFAPGYCDCRGLAFDSDGKLYVTSNNFTEVPFVLEQITNVGTVVKIDVDKGTGTVIKSQLVEPKQVAVVGTNLVVEAADKLTLYSKTGTFVKDVAAGDITSVAISAVAIGEEVIEKP